MLFGVYVCFLTQQNVLGTSLHFNKLSQKIIH